MQPTTPHPSRQRSERKRMRIALLLSLLFHALLLGLTFGGQGVGLPGFGFPWQERRAEVPNLRIVLAAAPFGAFTAAMRGQADQIVVTSRFRFTRDEELQTTQLGR